MNQSPHHGFIPLGHRRRARWPLSFRASHNQLERTYEISPERSTGCAEAGATLLDDNAAVLAAIVDLTAARKRLDAVVASFTGHVYDQDASDRGAKVRSSATYRVLIATIVKSVSIISSSTRTAWRFAARDVDSA